MPQQNQHALLSRDRCRYTPGPPTSHHSRRRWRSACTSKGQRLASPLGSKSLVFLPGARGGFVRQSCDVGNRSWRGWLCSSHGSHPLVTRNFMGGADPVLRGNALAMSTGVGQDQCQPLSLIIMNHCKIPPSASNHYFNLFHY